MSSNIQIVVSQEQGRVPITVFHIKGDIGADNYDQIQSQASEAFENGTRDLILDLGKVTYMSSAGLRAIHTIFKKMHPDTSDEAMKQGMQDWWQGGAVKSPHFKIVAPSSNVLKTITTAGFDAFLEIHKNLKDAVASF